MLQFKLLNQEHFHLLGTFLDTSFFVGGRLTKKKRLKTVQLTWDGLLVGGIANSPFRQASIEENSGARAFLSCESHPKGLNQKPTNSSLEVSSPGRHQ